MSTPAGVETRGPAIVGVAIAFPILAAVFVSLRVYSRTRVVNFFGSDDWCAIATLIVSIIYSVLVGIWTTHGGGMHQPDVTDSIMEEYYKWLLIQSEFYALALLGYKVCYLEESTRKLLIRFKTAILLLYIRIFSVHTKFRWACYGVMAFNAGYLLSNIILQIFSCTPVQKYYEPKLPGHCVSLIPPDIAWGAMSMASDFAIAILPIPIIWMLKMSKHDKILISLVFLSGLIAFAMALIRWILGIVDLTAEDRTWGAGLTFLFSIIEVNTGIICGCTATLKPLFKFAREHASHRKSSGAAQHEKNALFNQTSSSDEEAAARKNQLRAPPGTMDMSTNKSTTREESPVSSTTSHVPMSKSSTARPSIAEALPADSNFSNDLLNLPREGTRQQPGLRPQAEVHEVENNEMYEAGNTKIRSPSSMV